MATGLVDRQADGWQAHRQVGRYAIGTAYKPYCKHERPWEATAFRAKPECVATRMSCVAHMPTCDR
jgi:hypothetical protein